ncbi:glycosyltransferase family 2 protein [Metabacillus sp. GX 13764]|uniref:glycosyltransferase family A protein n=1 Tax=Metabacillus kandeliae TaxID=2900151 RepID=UPI001E30F328|nr:glycosyltransferase family A protein [Metabacillus kandeliae]MCD7033140.1 glycosyltransferase family 2 protein [Metabacillus kandeliae]
MAELLTIFTPTYNRAYTLHLGYESLKKQTYKDFIWLIIDDGSEDETRDLVNSWMKEDLIKIRYHYQENQGMHGAHNTAYQLIDTELNVCIDSDDYMPNNAVEKIIETWEKNKHLNIAGIVGLDANPDGNIIGTKMPDHLKCETLSNLYSKHRVKGDKKLVLRTDLTKKVPPYPIFPGEKYCPLSYKYILIDQECPLLLLNEVLCYVEYLEDGSSMNMISQYKKNPRGFSFFRKTAIKYAPTLKDSLREAAHYVSSSLLSKNYDFLKESPKKVTTFLAIPVGILLYLYINNTKKLTVK